MHLEDKLIVLFDEWNQESKALLAASKYSYNDNDHLRIMSTIFGNCANSLSKVWNEHEQEKQPADVDPNAEEIDE